jgi:hypothetical protein
VIILTLTTLKFEIWSHLVGDHINCDCIKRLLLYLNWMLYYIIYYILYMWLPFIKRSSPSIWATSEPSQGEASKNKIGKKRKSFKIRKSRLMLSRFILFSRLLLSLFNEIIFIEDFLIKKALFNGDEKIHWLHHMYFDFMWSQFLSSLKAT